MRTLIFPIAVMLLLTTAQAANRKLPQEFVGDWCPSTRNLEKWTPNLGWTRGRWCRESDAWMTVRRDGSEGHEQSCKVLSAVPKSGSYLVKFRCHGEGDTWITNNRMSLDKGRLLMEER